MDEDNSDLRRVVQNLKLESDLYIRHLNFTLAGGAAAGLISLFCCGLAIFFKSKSDGRSYPC
jgi:hypothetical protein